MILTENELFAQFVLLSGSKIYFFWQKYTSQTKCFFGSLSNWSLWFLPKFASSVLWWPQVIFGRAGKSSKWAPNFSYVILGSQDLEAKIRPNQCIYSFPCTQCGCTYNYQSLCHEISLLQLLKNIKTFDFSENWLSNSINPNLAPTVRLQGK